MHVPFLALNPTLAGGIFVCAHHRSGPRRVRVRDVMVVKTKPVVGMGKDKDKDKGKGKADAEPNKPIENEATVSARVEEKDKATSG